jgi:hypothetical protein
MRIKLVINSICQDEYYMSISHRLVQPRVALHRLGQTFVLDQLKTEEARRTYQNDIHDVYMRPNITDDLPIFIDTHAIPSSGRLKMHARFDQVW